MPDVRPQGAHVRGGAAAALPGAEEGEMSDALSLERLLRARETLTALSLEVIGGAFPGAVEAEDPWSTLIEAKRNLTAYCQWAHGEDGFTAALAQEELK